MIIILAVMLSALPAGIVQAASVSSIYSAVKNAYGSEFPFSASNEIKVSEKNAFGGYSKVLGVSTEHMKSYKAYRKADSQSQYICFVCKVTEKSKVKAIKQTLKSYVANEKKSNENYYSSTGKELISNAKIGSKKKYVYLFMIDTGKNEKAVTAFDNAL